MLCCKNKCENSTYFLFYQFKWFIEVSKFLEDNQQLNKLFIINISVIKTIVTNGFNYFTV